MNPNDTDRAAAELADRARKERGGALPLRVVGYNPQTDENGEIVLYVQRSPLELKPEEVRAHPAILKQIVGAYIVAEGQQAARPAVTT